MRGASSRATLNQSVGETLGHWPHWYSQHKHANSATCTCSLQFKEQLPKVQLQTTVHACTLPYINCEFGYWGQSAVLWDGVQGERGEPQVDHVLLVVAATQLKEGQVVARVVAL